MVTWVPGKEHLFWTLIEEQHEQINFSWIIKLSVNNWFDEILD